VILAVVSGAMRRFAALYEEEPEPLRAMVPVSVRGEGDESAAGNRITFAFIDLPIEEPRPARRLAVVAGRMGELKRSGRIGGSEVILRGTERLPGFLKERAARMAASPRMYNLTVSNVPGPRIPLYAAGAEVEAIYPVIPNSDEHAIAIGVLTYGDAIHFSCYVDPEALEEAPELAGLVRAALEELEEAVGVRTRPRPRTRGQTQARRSARRSAG
jgi:diacylglycerol O-acyltransferase